MSLPSETFLRYLRRETRAMGLAVSPAEERDFARLWALVCRWNEKTNLTAISAPGQAARVLFAESLLAERMLGPMNGRWLDVGSGAGFPALPLALRSRLTAEWTLVEARRRKAAFLREAALELKLALHAVPERLEEAARRGTLAGPFQGLTMRGAGESAMLWEALDSLMAPGAAAALFCGEELRHSARMKKRVEEAGRKKLSGGGFLLAGRWRG